MNNNQIQQDKKETFCLISVDKRDEWVHGIIANVNLNKHRAEIFLSSRHLKGYFEVGNKVTIKSPSSKDEFLFSGTVQKIITSIRKQALVIKIDDVKKFFNYRSNERFYVNYDANVITQDGKTFSTTMGDISLGGLLLLSGDILNENDNVKVEILADKSEPINISGKIIRKIPNKSGFRYGVQIDEVDDLNNQLLTNLIELLALKKKQIAHEWKLFKKIKYTVYAITVVIIFFVVFIILASEGR